MTFPVQWSRHHNIMIGQPKWHERLWGEVVIMHICQYKIKGSVLPGMLFHDLLEAKVPQQATDIQTIESPVTRIPQLGYFDSTRVRD